MVLHNPLTMSAPTAGNKKTLRQLFVSLAGATLLAGCEGKVRENIALAQTNTDAAHSQSDNAPAPEKLTLEDCTTITDQVKMIDCFEELGKQQEAEQAEIKVRREILKGQAEEARERLEERILEPER